MTYLIEIEGVDGTDATWEIDARNEHQARRMAVDRWDEETNHQPVYAITTDGRRTILL